MQPLKTKPHTNTLFEAPMRIAAFRARESARTDAAFKDPYAAILAGADGITQIERIPGKEITAFSITLRTVAIDRLVQIAVSEGVNTVINLGAGFDTRPYRLNLPALLHWIEVGLPEVIAYKEGALQAHKPVCQLTRLTADISNDKEREDLFASLGQKTRNALVITEGLIPFLTTDDVSKLSRSILNIPSFRYWIQDYRRGSLPKNNNAAANQSLNFSVANPLYFFKQHGWRVQENILMTDEANRIDRRIPFVFPWSLLAYLAPKRSKQAANQKYGYVLLSKG